jgi:hypothetical protein
MRPPVEAQLDRLREQRAQAASQLAAGLATGDQPLPELRELQERLGLLDAALADQRGRNERRLSALLWPLLLVAAVLLLAATVPVPSVPLQLELQASAVTLGLPDATVLAPQALGQTLRIEGATGLESADPALTAAAQPVGLHNLALQAQRLRLRALHLSAGSQLSVQVDASTPTTTTTQLLIDSTRAPVMVDVELQGPTQLRFDDADTALQRVYGHAEWLRLVGGEAAHPERAAPPLTLWLQHPGESPLQLARLQPSTLRFAERRAGTGTQSSVGSSIDSGTLTLPATGQTLSLAGGDWLALDGLVLERCEISVGTAVRLKLSGSARGLHLRVGEFERSLKPSVLEYVSRHHLVGLLWGSAALLWGLLAAVRKGLAGLVS